jgi:hypothetical protein
MKNTVLNVNDAISDDGVEIVNEFYDVISNQIELDTELAEFIEDNFWDLV